MTDEEQTDRIKELEKENKALRENIAELERRLEKTKMCRFLTRKSVLLTIIPIFLLFIGIMGIILYPMGIAQVSEKPLSYTSYIGLSALLAGSSLLIGGCIGFLFGIPQTVQEQGEKQSREGKKLTYRPNTNLEQISDWLTKILVGVSLTQIPAIYSAIEKLSEFLSSSFGSHGNVYSITVILYFTSAGFLGGYLATRLLYPSALIRSDASVFEQIALLDQDFKNAKAQLEDDLKDTKAELEGSIAEVTRQQEIDAKTLALIEEQIDWSEDKDRKKPDIKFLRDNFSKASPSLKEFVKVRIKEIRKENLINNNNKQEVAQIIPIYLILLEDKSESISHETYGELGYALKDQKEPNWQEAHKMLTQAIELRDKTGNTGHKMYELNRAHCRIMLDENFNHKPKKKKSQNNTKKEIQKDLAIAITEKKPKRIIREYGDIMVWLDINEVKLW